MRYWHWAIVICLMELALFDRFGESRVVGHNGGLSLSFCTDYSNTQLRLNYSCHNINKGEFKNKLNTFEVTEHFCGNYDDQKKVEACKNISLLFILQRKSVCIANSPQNAAVIKQVHIDLPVDFENRHLVCSQPQYDDQLLHNNTFSCAAANIDELTVKISGYDVNDPFHSIWTTMVRINITCGIDTDSEDVDQGHKSFQLLHLTVGVGVISGIGICISVVITYVIMKCYNKRRNHSLCRRLNACELMMDKLSGNPPSDPPLMEPDASNDSQPQTMTTCSDVQVYSSNTSVHQQDNSSENVSIDSLPKAEKYIVITDSKVHYWINSSK